MEVSIRCSSLCVLFAIFFASCTGSSDKSKAQTMDKDVDQDGFIEMLDVNSLQGWRGDDKIWHVKDGILVGEMKEGDEPLKNNTFLIWEGGEPANFEFKASFRISENGNSGVNYRSELVADLPFALKGYQADIDGQNNYTGQNYEERKRTTLAYRGQIVEIPENVEGVEAVSKNNAWSNVKIIDSLGEDQELKDAINKNDWNTIRIVARGNKLQHYINDRLMSEVQDSDNENFSARGLIGFQVHVGPPMKVEYKDVLIKNYDN